MKQKKCGIRLLTATPILIFFVLCAFFIMNWRSESAKGSTTAAQPAQLKSGPGGSDYRHKDMAIFHFGSNDGEYWLFEPSSPKPKSAPVVVFLHGWGGMNPQIYGAWIRHIVRRGSIVIFPRYQTNLRTKPSLMTPAAISAVKDAFENLKQPGHVKPETGHFAVVGHSLGGAIAANIAATAKDEGLPTVRAVMAVESGDSKNPATERARRLNVESILGDYSTIPPETLLLCVIGNDDRVAGDSGAIAIFTGATSVPLKNKAVITINSDNHGTPPLVADHFFPVAPDKSIEVGQKNIRPQTPIREMIRNRIRERFKLRRESREESQTEPMGKVDALDYYGSWRLFDALTDCAFYKRNCDYALNDTPKLRFMGRWSDGVPVKELSVTKNPKPNANLKTPGIKGRIRE